MSDVGLDDSDRARIQYFLSKPRHERDFRDLVPADDPDGADETTETPPADPPREENRTRDGATSSEDAAARQREE